MEFKFTIEDSIYISEDDLNEMAEQVKRGTPVGIVVTNYITGLSDFDYYCRHAYRDKVIDEVRKRASI